tara:strand:+ start:10450 stop:10620 length:171 start_codon:yes stop_codon:yes gene_type:complete
VGVVLVVRVAGHTLEAVAVVVIRHLERHCCRAMVVTLAVNIQHPPVVVLQKAALLA